MVCEGGRRGRGERDGDDKKTRSVTVKWEERWLVEFLESRRERWLERFLFSIFCET